MQFGTRTSRFDASHRAKIQLTKSSCLRSRFDSFFLTNNYIFSLERNIYQVLRDSAGNKIDRNYQKKWFNTLTRFNTLIYI